MKLCGLWRPEGQLGRPFWAKPVLRSFSGPRIGSVGASCFVDDFVSCWVEGSFLCFRRLVAWLFAAKRRRISLVQPWVIAWSVSCWCGVCGFSRRRSASIWIIVLNTLLPLVGLPCPSRLLPKFSAQKEYELSFFQSIPLLINSINLKRDGVRICLGKDVERWSIECFLTPPSFRYRVNYIG